MLRTPRSFANVPSEGRTSLINAASTDMYAPNPRLQIAVNTIIPVTVGRSNGTIIATPITTAAAMTMGLRRPIRSDSGPEKASDTMTAWVGPWGTSFTANLTPDPETGLGRWTEKDFIQTIRTGRHQGQGRPILPPMLWEQYRNASDDDLKAVFAYLRQVPAIRNRVPQPVDPPEAQASAGQH